MLMECNGAREIVRRDQTMMYRGIHPRQEPCAVVPLAGICAGGRGCSCPYRDPIDSCYPRKPSLAFVAGRLQYFTIQNIALT